MPHSHKKQQAAAIRRLVPCQGGVDHYARSANASCPSWGMTALRRSHHQQQDMPGFQGQSVLAFPLRDADLSVKLPPGLQLSATPAGHLDCRLQLLGVHLDWPAAAANTSNDSGAPGLKRGPHVLPAQSTVAGFACRSGALLLAHALFPDHTKHLLAWLAVPVAVADTLGVVAAATPAAAQHAVHGRAQQLKARLQRMPAKPEDDSSQRWGWVDGVQGLVVGSLHTFRSLSGPAAVLATGSWLWSLVSPSSHMVCSAVVALMAVAADYNSLGRDVATGKIPPGKAVEAAWRARHKAAAQRLAEYCGDLPSSAPLAPFIEAASHCSIAAGLAFGGCGLSGQLPPSLCSPADWLLPQQSTACARRRGEGSMQLVLSGSVVASRSQGKLVHEAAGLSRSQLLELFTGSSQDELVPPAAAGAAPLAAVTAQPAGVQDGAVTAPVAGAVRMHETAALASTSSNAVRTSSTGAVGRTASTGLPLLASTVAAAQQPPPAAAEVPAAGGIQPPSLRVSADSASDRSVDAVICIKRRLRDKPKPEVPCNSNRHPGMTLSRTSSGVASSVTAPSDHDPLAFLDDLPLYGQQDHTHLLAVQAAAAAAAGDESAQADPDLAVFDATFDHSGGLAHSVMLCVRAAYLLLVFAPFLLFGLPLLLLSWWLLTRAAASQQQQQQVTDGTCEDCATISTISTSTGLSVSSSKLSAAKAFVQELLVSRPSALAVQLLQQAWRLVLVLLALLDLLLVLLLGGHWAAGVSAWESAGMWLRKQAWMLLHFSCSRAGAAFIKWGQWSATRRDIFPADFCDVLSTFHDRAPVHSYRHTRRQLKAALGVEVEQLFDSFDPKPLASGSIAQVHKATLKPDAYRQYIMHPGHEQQEQQQQQRHTHSSQPPCEQQVVVKVCHPNVAEHIRLDFRLVALLSAAASKLPLLRGLPLRESVAQFSHTMTAQTDLRVEAVHALRFHNNFAGVKSSVSIPRPIPGLVSSTVLVESFEAGRSVAVFMKEPHAINTQIVALGVDAYLKMLLVDNFVHTDLHPGNILFRSLPARVASRKQAQVQVQQQQQQQQQRGRGSLLRRLLGRRDTDSSSGQDIVSADALQVPGHDADDVIPQWERELLAMSAQHQQRWESRHGALAAPARDSSSSNSSSQQVVPDPSNISSGAEAPETAQLVLLDFGLAEQLTEQVRYHFISFLNAISAGDGLAASHHLLRWSSHQTCPDKHAFRQDMADLFSNACNIHSPQGIDLDAVMTSVLSLARKHGVMIDSCYASLVISVCVLVGFAKALDPQVNLMDAATPTLLAYALTGKVVGRLYS